MKEQLVPKQPWWERHISWLPAFLVTFLIVSLGLGIWFLASLEERYMASAGVRLSLGAAELAEKLDTLLERQSNLVRRTAKNLERDGVTSESVNQNLLSIKNGSRLPVWIGITNHFGEVIGSTNEQFLGEEVITENRDQGKASEDQVRVNIAGGVETPEGQINPIEKTPLLAWSSKVLDAKSIHRGTVISRLEMSTLEPFFKKTVEMLETRLSLFSQQEGSLEYGIVTPEGLTVFDSIPELVGKVNPNPFGLSAIELFQVGQPGYVEGSHLHRKVPVLTGYAPIQELGMRAEANWVVLLRVDKSSLLAPFREDAWKVAIVWALVGLPAGGFLLLISWYQREYSKVRDTSRHAEEIKQLLAEREEHTRVIVDAVPDAMISFDQEGCIIDWNVQAERMFGWSRVEMLGQSIWTTIIPGLGKTHLNDILYKICHHGEIPKLGTQEEMIVCRHDGLEFPVELAVAPARKDGGFVFSAFFRDIGNRKLRERRLQMQNAVTQVLGDATTTLDANSRIVRALGDTLGWGLGMSWGIDRFAQVLQVGEVWHSILVDPSEFVHVSKEITFARGIGLPGRVWATGEPVWIRDVLEDSNFPRVEAAAKVGLHSAFAFPIKSGGQVHGVFEFYSHEILEPDKDLLGMVEEIGINVGQFFERKETEAALRETEAQLRQAQKMEAIGRVAGGVAHDFNNLLTVITGYTHLLLAQVDQHDPMRQEIEEIKKAGNRAASLTGQLLAFSRRQVIAPQVLDLNAVVTNMEGMLRRLMGEDIIELVTFLAPDLGRVEADPGQIDQVIMNLAVNARDAMPQGGKLVIGTSNATIGGIERGRSGIVQPGSYVRLILTDTGCGMDQKTLSQIFEPFFTTKDQGKGTGLGLSTVYGIVKQNGGDVVVDSQVGKGTKVTIYFPTVDQEITEALVEVPLQLTHIVDETILVVEDEPGVRGLVTAALRNGGYSVLEARDGIHAQVVSKSHFGHIDLLLTDVVMPQKSGPEAAKELLLDRPDMKVLYMSGYPDHPVFSHGPVDKTKLLMQKPFMPESLTKRVREVLEMPNEEFKRLHPVS